MVVDQSSCSQQEEVANVVGVTSGCGQFSSSPSRCSAPAACPLNHTTGYDDDYDNNDDTSIVENVVYNDVEWLVCCTASDVATCSRDLPIQQAGTWIAG